MAEIASENLILFDWFSFSIKGVVSVQDLIFLLGFPDSLPWLDTSGARGYKERKYFAGISIHFNGRDDMGVWVEMSGQGCRSFEDFSSLSWFDLFDWVINNKACHVTRLDVAFDDHTGLLPLDRILSDLEHDNYISRSKFWEVVRSSKGSSCYVGSPQSLIRFRFYDKAAERGYDSSVHWVRLEMQLRDERALQFLNLLYTTNKSIGSLFVSVVYNYLRFLEPSLSDSNKSRWDLSDYWELFISGCDKISIYVSPGSDYNLEQIKDNVFNRWGNAIDCVLKALSYPEFKAQLDNRSVSRNPKYDLALKEYFEGRKLQHERQVK